MTRKDLTALRDEAAKAIERGKPDRAIELYIELEALEPANPQWSKKLGETHRRKGSNRDAIKAFERAASKYAHGGFLVQAIAVCKLILQIDATHSSTIAMLMELAPAPRQTTPAVSAEPRPSAPPPPSRDEQPARFTVRAPTAGGDERGTPRSPAPRPASVAPSRIPSAPPRIPPAPPLRPAAPPLIAVPVAVPAGRALDALDLATVIPGSKRLSTKGGQWTGINVVSLDEPLVLLEPPDDAEPPVQVDAPSEHGRAELSLDDEQA
ncbi:hypothetical protein BH11MYX2_BH11MYX2_10950 [soil metagenome]